MINISSAQNVSIILNSTRNLNKFEIDAKVMWTSIVIDQVVDKSSSVYILTQINLVKDAITAKAPFGFIAILDVTRVLIFGKRSEYLFSKI